MTSLVVADGQTPALSGLDGELENAGFEVIARLDGSDGALDDALRLDPDILLIDLEATGDSGGDGGLDILRRLRRRGDGRRIVFLASEIDDGAVLQAYRLGVDGLVLRQAEPDLLLACLGEVRDGRRWIDQSLLQRALDVALRVEPAGGGLSALSRREREIVDLVVVGRRNPEIAETLGIAAGTVKVHLHRIYEKLGVASRSDLVIYARDRGVAGGG